MYSSTVFTGVDLFALKFYLDRVVPINHSWHQKTRNTGLPDDENRISLRSLVLTQCLSVTDGRTDRRTDGRTDGYAVAYTALAKLALRRAVKTSRYLYLRITIHEFFSVSVSTVWNSLKPDLLVSL